MSSLIQVDPQVTISAGTPIPRNERLLSIKIADAIPNAILTKTGANALGRACLNIVLAEENLMIEQLEQILVNEFLRIQL